MMRNVANGRRPKGKPQRTQFAGSCLVQVVSGNDDRVQAWRPGEARSLEGNERDNHNDALTKLGARRKTVHQSLLTHEHRSKKTGQRQRKT
jgi:hypothetical protein